MPAKTQFQNGLLYEQAAEFAQALETSQVAATDQMLAAWTDSYWGIRKEMDTFLAKVAEAKAAGIKPSPAWAYQQQRLKNVLDETKRQIARYAADASLVTEKAQAAAIQAALKHAEKLGNAALAQSLPGVGVHMATVNPKVLEVGVGFLANGSVLRNHLALTLPGAAAAKVQEALIHGLATGKSQAWMSRRATEALGLSHSRATTILRTESLRAYRHASRATYLANQDVLGGWVWNAHLDSRTCVACALMDGTEHPLDATLDGHPRCRCAMVPRTRSWEDILGPEGEGIPDTRPPVRSGKAWLESQPAHVQRAMMGNAKFNAWAEGTITLDDMVGRTYSPHWGTMRSERSLVAILEGRNGNYFDAPAIPTTAAKPPAVAEPKYAKELADRYDLDYLNEWLDTPGNSPQALANVKAAIALKLARNKRPLGPALPRPDMGKVEKALEKLRQAVLTKGWPSKGYSQTQAIYKAQANGQVGSKVGVVKSLTWEQKITAQKIVAEHNEALPDLVRQWQKKDAIAKAHDEALAINAQKKAEALAKEAQDAADEAVEATKKDLANMDGLAKDAPDWSLQWSLKVLDAEDAVKAAGDDVVKKAKADAVLAHLKAHQQAYDDAMDTVKANGWTGTSWKAPTGPGAMDVDADGWGHVQGAGLEFHLPPNQVIPFLDGTGSSTWTQVLTPDPDEVKKWLDVVIKDADGLVTQKAYDKAKADLDDPFSSLTPQAKVDLQEALDQAATVEKWKPEQDYVTKIKGFLDDGTMDEDSLRATVLNDPDAKPLSKANAAQALKEWKAEQAAKASIPVPKPAIDPAKIKWEKVSDAQAQKWIDQVNQGKVTVDDLYVKFQASKNAGPKANYAKAILTLEGKDVGDLVPPMTKVPEPPSSGPAWPTKPPWDPNDLKATGQVLGTHGARVYEAPDGTRWLFKPPKDPKDGFLSTLDEAASRFQARVGLKAPDTYVVTLGGKRGSIQRMFPSSDGFPGGFRPQSLTGPDRDLVQREHALDWLLSNHDGHRDQFLRLQDGTMVGIDKGQAFRWFGQDRLDWDFHPNQAYGAPEPVYNALWRAFAKGDPKVELDPPGQGALWDQIKTIQAIPDDELRDLFRGYAEQAAARGLLAKRQQYPGLKPSSALENDVERFLDALVARKNRLDDDFRDLYDRAAKERAKAIPGWKPKAAAPSGKPGLQKWVGKEKPTAPKPPEPPTAEVAKDFDSWVEAAKDRYAQFSGGKSLENSNNWVRFERVVNELDAQAAKELLDRQYLRPEDYQEALDLIAKGKAKKAALDADFKKAMADHDKVVQAYKRDLKDWAEANGIKDLSAGMDDAVVRHNTDQAGVTWAMKHFSEDRYTIPQRTTLKSYTGKSYDAWNDHLRKTKGKPTQYLDTFRKIDKAMDAQPIPEDVILHRGTGPEAFVLGGVRLNRSDDLKKLIGSVQTEHAYSSTSVGNSAAFAHKPVQMKIRTPKGTPGSYVQMFSEYHTERELILGRGASFYVHNAYKHNGKWFLEVEVVPEDFDAANATPKPSATPWKE